jgi:DNA repair exonuclease SbcCD nuclease subunit
LQEKIIATVIETLPDFVVFLGDLSDTHEKIHTQCLNAIYGLLDSVSCQAPTFAIIGNHDILSPNLFLTHEHPFRTFDIEGRLKIIDKPTKMRNVLMVPYVPPGRFNEALAGFDMSTVKMIFCHQEFSGCKFNGKESLVGDSWTHNVSVVSGHIHEKQTSGKIYWTGTPDQTNFGESPNKTIALVDLNDHTGEITIHEISLNMPQKVTEHFDIAEARKFEVPDNTDLRLTITGTHDQIAAFKKTAKAQDLESKAKVVWKTTDVSAPTPVKRDSKTFLDLFWEYGKAEEEETKNMMLEVLK